MTEADRPATEVDSAAPWFCPRCGKTGPARDDSDLCPDCGDPVANQGFCPTCEDHWPQASGTLCPKHDIKLWEEAPPPMDLGDRTKLVTVATFSHPNQANPPRIRLEAEGIPTFLDGERIAGTTYYQVATGGVRLMVPAELASTARILIDQTWAAPPILDDDDTEDAWDELAPEPGRRRRAIMKAAILVILFGPAMVTILTWLARWFGV